MDNQKKTGLNVDKLRFIAPALVIAVLLAAGGWYLWQNYSPGQAGVSKAEIEKRLMAYVEETLPDTAASVVSIKEMKGQDLYEVELDIGGQSFTSYASADGKFLFPSAVDLDDFLATVESGESGVLEELPKRETPDAKLFVMSYCPYGLQAEKAFLPAWKVLDNEAELGIYFVDYIMHDRQEINENLRQYCIQEEQDEKLIAYLECFVESGESQTCLDQTGVDTAMLTSCVQSADQEFGVMESYENEDEWLSGRYPLFNVHADLNEQYGVGGSPTFVVNDTVVVSDKSRCPQGAACFVDKEFARTAESFKDIICQGFEEAPEVCSQELSTEAPAPSFGGGTVEGAASGACE